MLTGTVNDVTKMSAMAKFTIKMLPTVLRGCNRNFSNELNAWFVQ
jgi:hypothetical protein